MLWANFGAFCFGLITQPDGHEQIGAVLSNFHSDIRHYCMAQMRNFWLHLNVGISCATEEISLFVRKAMESYVVVSDFTSISVLVANFSFYRPVKENQRLGGFYLLRAYHCMKTCGIVMSTLQTVGISKWYLLLLHMQEVKSIYC